MESIFKSLSREYLSVKSVECKKRDLLEEIIEYVDSMEWLSRESLKSKITFFIKSGYDYSKFTEEFDISYESAKNSIKWAAKKLREKIGSNTLSLIKNGYIDEARMAFYVGTGKLNRDDLFVKDLVDILPKAKYCVGYDLTDCIKEISILKNLSQKRLAYYDAVMDRDKMAFLMDVLENNSLQGTYMRPYLIKVVQGELELSDLKMVQEEINKNMLGG